jgi:hypothetical protein
VRAKLGALRRQAAAVAERLSDPYLISIAGVALLRYGLGQVITRLGELRDQMETVTASLTGAAASGAELGEPVPEPQP